MGDSSPVVRLLRNEATEIVPRAGGGLQIRAVHGGGVVEATAYQVGLLEQFDRPALIDDVLRAFPFEQEAARAFLDAALRAAILVPVGDDGAIRLPERVVPPATLFGAPAFDPAAPAAFTFLGVPFDGATSGHPGARFGPAAVRGASEAGRYHLDPRSLAPVGFRDHGRGTTLLRGVTLADAGDVRVAPGEDPQRVFGRLERAVGEILGAGSIPGIIGGDHSITLAALTAAARAAGELTVVHFDAHTDLGTPLPGHGVDHGNVFTVALEALPDLTKLVQLGLRGLGEPDDDEPSPRVEPFGIHAARAAGIAGILRAIPRERPCWITVDIDVLDPAFAPSTGTPVPGGLWPHELLGWLDAIAAARPVIGFDVVEVAAPLGPADGTAMLALEALLTIADGIVRQARAAEVDR